MTVYFLEWNANYEKIMMHNLSELGVKEKNNVMKHFAKKNLKLKKLGISNRFFVQLHYFIKLRHITSDDLIVCNGFSALGFLDLVKTIKCKKILIIRDTITHLENAMRDKKKWLLPQEHYVDKVKPFFDKIYSFDPTDCKKHDLNYLEQFLPFTLLDIKRKQSLAKNKKSKICFFIGEYREERESYLRKIYAHLKSTDLKANFYLYDKYKKSDNYPPFCKNTLLSYNENIEKVIESDVLIEINHLGQDGPTLRTIEALAFNKKIITNNTKILNYEFYSPDRFFILGHDSFDNMLVFLKRDTSPIADEIIEKYTADSMLRTICFDMKYELPLHTSEIDKLAE
ncbi:hypothetical protein [Pectobacterium versatile]|uniref:hypothetical protein n=2 Tax=Pectobacterium versatile TaxID=2488639 RepID=UPI0030330BF8